MYRESDLKLFSIFSWISTLFGLGALILIVIYHFINSSILYRNLALDFLVFSAFFKIQLYGVKVEILEKKVMNLADPAFLKGKKQAGNTALILYFILFWITLLSIVIGFIPLPFSKYS